MMKTDLILTFTSQDRPGVVELLTTTVVSHGGNWEESRLAKLCGDFAGIVRISVPSENVDAFQSAVDALGDKGISATLRASSQPTLVASDLYMLRCDGADHEGIANRITGFLAGRGINVEEMTTAVTPAPTTGTPVFNMTCTIAIAHKIDIDSLQTELAQLGNQEAVDITLSANPAESRTAH
ncbi:MAG: glycine cleavage system protein R [Aureliella sp.]